MYIGNEGRHVRVYIIFQSEILKCCVISCF